MDHIREHRSLLAAAEKRLLIAIATRLPRFVTSDHLTLLGLAAMPAAGVAFAKIPAEPWSAALFALALAVNWFGDSLDGTLARVRNCQRPRYGFYVDHVVDEFGVAFLLGGLALSGYMSPAVAIGVLVTYLMLSIEVFLATHTLGTFRMSYFKVGPTELRILLAIGNAVAMVHPRAVLFGHDFLLFDVGGVVAAIGLFLTLCYSAISNTRSLYDAEPLEDRRR